MPLWDKTEEQQKFHFQMLADCKNILDKYKIKNILSGSALLGLFRAGDLVPWERGLVLIVFFDDVIKYQKKIIKDLLQYGFIIKKHFTNRGNWKIQAGKKEFVIEITGYFKEKNNYLRTANKRIRTIPEEFFNNAENKKMLYGLEFTIPNNPEKYLTHLYGDWKTVIRSDKPADFRAATFIRKL